MADQSAETAQQTLALIEPWGPFEMGGFGGCTDRSPENCACATDQQPTCEVCGQEIEPGERAWSRQWPCYNTLPLDDVGQDWDVISWHDECPDLRYSPGSVQGGGEPS